MNKQIVNEIVAKTCSTTLNTAIRESDFELSDLDLLLLVQKFAPDFDTRIELLELVCANATNTAVRMQARRCVRFWNNSLSLFTEPEEDCVFETKITIRPGAYEERYLAKTYEGALRKVECFCKRYDEKCSTATRIEIEKRRVSDDEKQRDFNEDSCGNAFFHGKCKLVSVEHNKLPSTKLDKAFCGKACADCEDACFSQRFPRLPHFISVLDIISCDFCGETEYYVVTCEQSDDDDSACCIPLDEINVSGVSSKDELYSSIFGVHTHVQLPMLEVVETGKIRDCNEKEYADKLISAYEEFLNVYRRFCD